ncbi:hypothetical protein NYE70_01885 [Paenibacillus sp. FSL R5-0407]|uniref:hypothetical protein n=1 Tax=Paenibacillus sp. FSL R5-0407 TaxID=2975320 RepID=UPI0030FB1C70
MLKFKILFLLLLVLMSTGCSFSSEDTWKERSHIKQGDVKQILIENSEGVSASLTDRVKISAVINALKTGVFDPGVFDIRVQDFTVTIELNNSDKKKIHLWLLSGANLFTDSEDDGHFTLNEDAQEKLVEIIKENELWNEDSAAN